MTPPLNRSHFPMMTCVSRLLAAPFLAVPMLTGLPSTSGAAEPKLNLILLIADDMGCDDCGAYGHPTIRTPNSSASGAKACASTGPF